MGIRHRFPVSPVKWHPVPPQLNKPALLIVDDDENLRYLFAAAANRCGEYTVVWQAANGRAALEVLRKMPEIGTREARPVFVLTDLSMPVLDGLDLVRAMKHDAVLRHLPIAMMTSSDRPSAQADALAAGCWAFFAKPERLDQITALVASLPSVCPAKAGSAAA